MNLGKLQEMVRDKEAWHAVVHGVTKCRTQRVTEQQLLKEVSHHQRSNLHHLLEVIGHFKKLLKNQNLIAMKKLGISFIMIEFMATCQIFCLVKWPLCLWPLCQIFMLSPL